MLLRSLGLVDFDAFILCPGLEVSLSVEPVVEVHAIAAAAFEIAVVGAQFDAFFTWP